MTLGIWQIALIVIVVLIIFGAGKLPKVMGDLGKGLQAFKKGIAEVDEKPIEKADPAVVAHATVLTDEKSSAQNLDSQKPGPKTSAAKKPAPNKAPVKKTPLPVKKSPVKKSLVKKPSVKKAGPKKTEAKKLPASKNKSAR